MAAFFPSSGPVDVYVGVGNASSAAVGVAAFLSGASITGKSPAYLGTGQVSPAIDWQPVNGPIFNDLGGDRPYDYQYSGITGVISIAMNRWDEVPFERIAALPFHGFPAPDGVTYDMGVTPRVAQGLFMMQSGYCYPVWLRYPNFDQGANAAQSMPPGYRFLQCFLEDFSKPKGGSKENFLVLQFRALAYPKSCVSGSPAWVTTWDQDVSALPALCT